MLSDSTMPKTFTWLHVHPEECQSKKCAGGLQQPFQKLSAFLRAREQGQDILQQQQPPGEKSATQEKHLIIDTGSGQPSTPNKSQKN